MPFQVSPSVVVTEKDLTNIIPAVSTSNGATVGQFAWGAVEQITIVDNEEELVSLFSKPSHTVFTDFMVTSSFLAYASGLKVIRVVDDSSALNASATATASGSGVLVKNGEDYDTKNFTSGTDLFIAKYPGVLGNSLGVAYADTAGFNDVDSNDVPTWPWHDLFQSAPETNEFHVVVYDADGTITGLANTVLEVFAYVSTQAGEIAFDGTSAYFKTKINRASRWVWVATESLLTGTSDGVDLGGGNDGAAIVSADRLRGWEMFKDSERVDINLLFVGGADAITSKWVIDNVVEVRKDCVVCVSPMTNDVVGIANEATKLAAIKTTRNSFGSTSYGIMDPTFKYMYDRYNDVNRWIPINGDIAGCMARTDAEYDPWFSPAGYEKGRIKNASKISFYQPKSIRDELYKIGINPILEDGVNGPILYGDKTLLTRPSAFGHINVRRLFIVLQKAIATASKYMLFEQNDEYTRARFVNMIEPFLADVQGRRGIEGFRVVCDHTNNTSEVTSQGEFIADIYIIPINSINVIKLNFIALRSGVDFEEIVMSSNSNQVPSI